MKHCLLTWLTSVHYTALCLWKIICHNIMSCGVVQETEEPLLFVVYCVLPSINNNSNSTSITIGARVCSARQLEELQQQNQCVVRREEEGGGEEEDTREGQKREHKRPRENTRDQERTQERGEERQENTNIL
ncbi:hypothetical protein Pcinc_014839 [Petrolisthes cinctipes]|uniref:Uncharacterized protein n=1 Tax=Petrolisthes cinctipes TaxID=88211 RepID=A0AAE1FW73_PETCI|nr:hypothetical protein Pcinc_014839 [Petrolisthes cinctipes]